MRLADSVDGPGSHRRGRAVKLSHVLSDDLIATAQRIWAHPENRHRRVSRLVRWVTWQAWERTVRRPWQVTLHDGVRMICRPHDTVTSSVIYAGLYDAEEMRFLLRWLRAGDTFVDVGANVAPYSLLAASVDGVRVVAFEPGRLAYTRAEANIRLNDVGDRLTLVPLAVGAEDGESFLTTGLSATNRLVEDAHEGVEGVERVDVVRLDSYAADAGLGRVSLIKVDVEGHELAVLGGASATLAAHRPALILEVNDPVDELRRFVESIGYVSVHFDPVAGTLEPRAFPLTRGGNVVVIPDLAAARARLASAG